MAKPPAECSESGVEELEPGAGEGTPVCSRCMRPCSVLEHYCRHCGESVGGLTPYIPFVNIRFACNWYGRLWRRIWFDREFSLLLKIAGVFVIIVSAPVMLLGLPFVRKSYRREHNLCLVCGHPLRDLTENRCPECFTKFDPADVPKD